MTSAPIMPRITAACAVVLGGACAFEASYGSGHYKCSDGACPSGLVCTAGSCVTPGSGTDAGSGSADAAMPDGPPPALTCGVPGIVGSGSGTFMYSDSTASRSPSISASCNSMILNGNDAVYVVTAAANETITIGIAATWAAKVYVIAPCTNAPAPTCIGSAMAMPGTDLPFHAGSAQPYFIVVDALYTFESGSYTLTITR